MQCRCAGPDAWISQSSPNPEGNPGLGPDVTARHIDATGQVRVVLTNFGGSPVHLSVTCAYGNSPAASYVIAAGNSVMHVAVTARNNGGYDLSIASAEDSAYLRRLAGHVETGMATMSDPAIATN